MNIFLIIMEGNHGYIDDDNSKFCGYYIIKFSSYQYTLQDYLSINGQVISFGEMVCEGTFLININSCYYFCKAINPITPLYL